MAPSAAQPRAGGAGATSDPGAGPSAKLLVSDVFLPISGVKKPPAISDTQSVQVALTHKFVFGSLVVGASVVGFPLLLGATGIDPPAWLYPFVALGAAALVGFFLSRDLTRSFLSLRTVTEQISRGNLFLGI